MSTMGRAPDTNEAGAGGRDPRYGWSIVVALGVTATVSYGVLGYAFAIVVVPMQETLGWSRAELTGAYSLSILVSGASALAVGRVLDRHSPRLPMTLGSLLAGALVFGWSRVDTLVELTSCSPASASRWRSSSTRLSSSWSRSGSSCDAAPPSRLSA